MKRIFIHILAIVLLISIPISSLATWCCTSCGRSNADTSNYCVSCGHAHSKSCSKCGNSVSNTDVYCGKCGAYLGSSSSGTTNSGAFTWPILNIQKISVTLNPVSDESKRRYSYAGPSNVTYIGAGGYKPYKVVKATAWFAEGDFVLVEVDYKTVSDRLVYFPKGSLRNKGGNVQSVTLPTHQATVTQNYAPMFGPGNSYDVYKDKDASLSAGQTVTGFFQVNGYVFCEFPAADGKYARGWVPVEYLRAQ